MFDPHSVRPNHCHSSLRVRTVRHKEVKVLACSRALGEFLEEPEVSFRGSSSLSGVSWSGPVSEEEVSCGGGFSKFSCDSQTLRKCPEACLCTGGSSGGGELSVQSFLVQIREDISAGCEFIHRSHILQASGSLLPRALCGPSLSGSRHPVPICPKTTVPSLCSLGVTFPSLPLEPSLCSGHLVGGKVPTPRVWLPGAKRGAVGRLGWPHKQQPSPRPHLRSCSG